MRREFGTIRFANGTRDKPAHSVAWCLEFFHMSEAMVPKGLERPARPGHIRWSSRWSKEASFI